jgi:CHAT domain
VSYVYIVSTDEGLGRHSQTGRYHSVRRGVRSWFKPGSRRLSRRGVKWHRSYLATGDAGHLDRALSDLSEAVWGRARSAADVRTSRRHWPEFANNFGLALLDAHKRSGDRTELDRAATWLRKALAETSSTSPLRCTVLVSLIAAVQAGADTAEDDLADLREELSQAQFAGVEDRLAAAVSWGYGAAAENPAAGLPGLQAAVSLLPRAAWWGQTWETREEVLAGYTGLASDAAACAVAAGQPARALELLEGGRAVMWTQVLRTRTDRAALRSVAPLLAKRMDRVAAALERDRGMSVSGRMGLVGRWSKMDVKARAKLLREWESLSARAQEAYPEGTFTMPAFAADLRPAGEEGPVAIVNVSVFGCDAVVVHDRDADEPQVIPLPDLTYEDVHSRAMTCMTALSTAGKSREQVVSDTLVWLGRTIVSPVLNALKFDDPADDRSRMWWCPTGPLMTLPLHAAALDTAISSYTPTLRVLIRARENWKAAQEADDADRRLLHVAVGDDLPGVARTRAYLEELIPAEHRTTLDAARVTPKIVAAKLTRYPWVHFDCHGVQDLDHPFRGGLVLRGLRLTVADVAATRHDRAEFAFLAACTTAVGGTRIPDESITLTAALQYAGFQSVIGTLWTIPDRSAERVTRSVYGDLISGGQLCPALGAQALHTAVLAERTRMPKHPSAWVPFIHVGL